MTNYEPVFIDRLREALPTRDGVVFKVTQDPTDETHFIIRFYLQYTDFVVGRVRMHHTLFREIILGNVDEETQDSLNGGLAEMEDHINQLLADGIIREVPHAQTLTISEPR